MISRLFAFLVALSLLFGPLAMDRAMAAAPAASHSQMTDDAHCQPADDDKADKAKSDRCCAAMCVSAALAPQATASKALPAPLSATAAPADLYRGILSELSTPPPRNS